MCGVAGLLGIPPTLAEGVARRMLAAMHHRGPDDWGLAIIPGSQAEIPPAVFVHVRLAILEPTPAGYQPMSDRPQSEGLRSNWIVFNGEILNFQELQKELARVGWPCRTHCDTEVILHAYRAWGESCVERMRGMFAWCLLDAERGTVWFCRDRLGVKPLYLAWPATGGLLFASELRTLLAAGPGLVPSRVNPVALESFLAQGAVWGTESFIQDITLLNPGESLITDWDGRPRRRRQYWQLSPGLPLGDHSGGADLAGRGAAIERLRGLSREVVQLALVADVPIGLFLSGGIDSAALLTLANEVAGATIETISVGFDQPEFDETKAAEAITRAFGTHHHSVRLTGRAVLDALSRVLESVDQPTSDGLNSYFISQAARQAGLKVALSGLGGDELFGGYSSFLDVPRAVRLRRGLLWASCFGSAFSRAARLAGGRRGLKAAELFRRGPSLVSMYLLRREQFLPDVRRLLHPLPDGSDPICGLPRSFVEGLETGIHGNDLINRISWLELSTYMRDTLLRDTDVFSMAHGLEIRVPYLDHKLVEEIFPLPGVWKRPDLRPKPLLVDTIGVRLPRRAYSTSKRGFDFPLDAWFRGCWQRRIADAMADRGTWSDLGFDPSAPPKLWERFQSQDPGITADLIYALVVLADYGSRHKLTRAA
jgi:asparagine synthase (glutamine-hydrolysing)